MSAGKQKKVDLQTKRENEKSVIELMIRLYCKGNHHTGELCPECTQLLAYAEHRVDVCPFMESKTFCSNCRVHCYKPDMREKVRAVMRYSGPRMLFHHPVLAVRHLIETKKEKKRLEKAEK